MVVAREFDAAEYEGADRTAEEMSQRSLTCSRDDRSYSKISIGNPGDIRCLLSRTAPEENNAKNRRAQQGHANEARLEHVGRSRLPSAQQSSPVCR